MSIELKHGMADGTAEEFVLAAIHLSKACSETKLIAPTMMCFAFAIELHLKAILASCDIDPKKTHNLYTLYMKLPNEKKAWVIKMYSLIEGDIAAENFETEIKKWSDAFMKIRYYHDRTSKNQAIFDFSNFIPNLAIAINNSYLHTEKHEKFCFPQL
ncbi:MAG: HEPN domain-containing protein [Colwellia sp.]|nr:HEPN domain-containing protein [Colwellia sp.]